MSLGGGNKHGGSARLTHLEWARGFASIIVIFHHFTMAFFPGLKAAVGAGGLEKTPAFILINGDGAVVFFFTLSGFVLTIKFYQRFSLQLLCESVVKRLPRLIVPAGLSMVIGMLVIQYGGDTYLRAAHLTESSWLANFGDGWIPSGLIPSVSDVMKRSLLVFLLPGHFYYNSNLWTMRSEFYGSLIVFGITPLILWSRRYRFLVLTVAHVALALVCMASFRSAVPFVIGSYLAYLWSSYGTKFRLSNRSAVILLVLTALAFSTNAWKANLLGSAIVITVLLGNTNLAVALSGRMGRILGLASFPLYLVHTLVILSVSSAVFVALAHHNLPIAVVGTLTLLVTLLVSAIACLPFIIVEKVWTRSLNRAVAALLRPAKASRPSPATGATAIAAQG